MPRERSEYMKLPEPRDIYYEASDNLLKSDDDESTIDTEAYDLQKEITIPGGVTGSQFRISFDFKKFTGSGSAYCRIYRNGEPIGSEFSRTQNVWATRSEDITGWLQMDKIQLYGKVSPGCVGKCRNFRIFGDLKEIKSSQKPDWS